LPLGKALCSWRKKLKIRVLIITLTCLSVCLSALASATDNKVELEVLVSNYEELAVDAKNCTDSRNQKSAPCTRFIEIFNNGEINNIIKSFGNNVSRYFSIDQELTLRGVTAVGHVADTLGFLFEKQTQKLQKRT
jgi:thioredoxin-related protein